MRLTLAAVTARRQGMKAGPARELFQTYVDRIVPSCPVDVLFADTESSLLERLHRETGRTPPYLVLLDSLGKPTSSEALAGRLRDLRDAGTQQVFFAVGPASGWSEAARAKAAFLLSLGPMTLPHELAMVILAEQLYRAHMILAGHPYHSGH